MDNFMISGIQQIGVGTEDFRKSWDWYIDMFGIDVKILEDDTVAERMLPYTGGKPQQRHACIAVSLQGGGGFEIWQYSKRKPVACPFTISVGDLGIFAAKLNCCDVSAFHCELSARKSFRTALHASTSRISTETYSRLWRTRMYSSTRGVLLAEWLVP